MSDVIRFGTIIEFELDDLCIIRYDVDNRIWYASHEDEEKYPDDIIINDEDFISDDQIILFDQYILTQLMFNQFKMIVEKELQNKWNCTEN